MKKSFAFGMLLASSLLVACGGGTSTTSSTPASSSTPATTTSESKTSSAEATSSKEEVTVAYEITASYDELYDMFAAFEFYGLLYSDGTGVLYSAMIQNSAAGEKANVPQVGDPTSFKYKVTNDDDIETLEAAIDGKKFTGYKNKDGDFVLQSYSFPFAGGYSRSVDLIVSEDIVYGSEEEWEKAVAEEYKGRTITVVVSDAYKGPVVYADGDKEGEPFVIDFGAYGAFNAEAKFELNSDFTLKASYGVGGSNGGASFDGTWTINQSQLHVLTIGETELVGEKDGEHEKFVWNFSHQAKDAEGQPVGDPINLTSTLTWFDINAQE